ncbi:hypothetical protein [Vibrio splendidus]|uniref:hypothetical protein n=1 Tax=Vibrio splendidus TaxID=29497 RepID=UPI000E325AAA|nr:hypothetical protein [Vibrio splendidus]
MKFISAFLSRYEVQILCFATLAFILSVAFGVIYLVGTLRCNVEISNSSYAQIVIGSHEYDEIKQMATRFLANDNRIDYCEASDLQDAYDQLTSSKAVLLGWL